MVHNFVNRIFPVYQDGNNDDPIGYRFEILYFDNFVLSDGLLYSTFDECVESMCKSSIRLYTHKRIDPIVVNFSDL